jgi:hypothetical protein
MRDPIDKKQAPFKATEYNAYHAINYDWILPNDMIAKYLDAYYILRWSKAQIDSYSKGGYIIRQHTIYKALYINCVPLDTVDPDTFYLLSFRNTKSKHRELSAPVVLITQKRI